MEHKDTKAQSIIPIEEYRRLNQLRLLLEQQLKYIVSLGLVFWNLCMKNVLR